MQIAKCKLQNDCRLQIGWRIRRRIGSRIAVTLLLAWIAGNAVRAETIDRVLAVVGGQLITLTDVTAATDLGLQTAEGAADPVRGVLSKLIDRELALAEVDRYAPPEPTAAMVDSEVERVRHRFTAPAAFDAALARSGIDEQHLRETLRQDLRTRAYLDQRFGTATDRAAVVNEWIAGLRRRGGVIDLYLAGERR
jgi:hypothetical protein